MTQRLSCILASLMVLLCASCKKDLLQWQKVQKLNSNTNGRLNHVKFINNNICVINGGVQWSRSEALRSTDGGYTWADDSFSVKIETYGMGVAPNGNIYLSTYYGNVIYSKDLGISWQQATIGDYQPYVGGFFVTPDTGIFVNTTLERMSGITRVDSNFKIIDLQTFVFGLNNIYMTTSSEGYVIGYGTVMKTTDRGNTWKVQNVAGDNFEAMDVHGNEIWMCGYMGSIYHTTDGGENWQRLRNGNDITLPRYYLMDIVFKDSQNGWAVCDNGKMIHTDDGGKHWEEYQQFTTSSLRGITLCPNNDLLVVGDNGSIYRLAAQ